MACGCCGTRVVVACVARAVACVRACVRGVRGRALLNGRAPHAFVVLALAACAVMAKTPAKKAAKEGKKKSGHKKAKKESYGIYIYKVRACNYRAPPDR